MDLRILNARHSNCVFQSSLLWTKLQKHRTKHFVFVSKIYKRLIEEKHITATTQKLCYHPSVYFINLIWYLYITYILVEHLSLLMFTYFPPLLVCCLLKWTIRYTHPSLEGASVAVKCFVTILCSFETVSSRVTLHPCKMYHKNNHNYQDNSFDENSPAYSSELILPALPNMRPTTYGCPYIELHERTTEYQTTKHSLRFFCLSGLQHFSHTSSVTFILSILLFYAYTLVSLTEADKLPSDRYHGETFIYLSIYTLTIVNNFCCIIERFTISSCY